MFGKRRFATKGSRRTPLDESFVDDREAIDRRRTSMRNLVSSPVSNSGNHTPWDAPEAIAMVGYFRPGPRPEDFGTR
jgi:hypothetical protein